MYNFLYLKTLERYFFITLLICPIYGDYKEWYLDYNELIQKILKKEIATTYIIKQIDKVINHIVSTYINTDELYEYYSENGFYSGQAEQFTCYLMQEYEQYLFKQSKTGVYRIDMKEFIKHKSLEHIYPWSSNNPYWKERFNKFSPRQRDSLRNSLGNLVLISKQKNSRLGNKPFPEKICNKNNTVGFKFGSYSEIELTNFSDWTDSEIVKRGLKLIDFIHQRWSISIGNGKKKNKLRFLGVYFLEDSKTKTVALNSTSIDETISATVSQDSLN